MTLSGPLPVLRIKGKRDVTSLRAQGQWGAESGKNRFGCYYNFGPGRAAAPWVQHPREGASQGKGRGRCFPTNVIPWQRKGDFQEAEICLCSW